MQPMTTLLIALVRFYQFCIRPMIGSRGCCRFYPSCSQYAIKAFEKYGPYKGCWLICKRILKCAPWHPGGFDDI